MTLLVSTVMLCSPFSEVHTWDEFVYISCTLVTERSQKRGRCYIPKLLCGARELNCNEYD